MHLLRDKFDWGDAPLFYSLLYLRRTLFGSISSFARDFYLLVVGLIYSSLENTNEASLLSYLISSHLPGRKL